MADDGHAWVVQQMSAVKQEQLRLKYGNTSARIKIMFSGLVTHKYSITIRSAVSHTTCQYFYVECLRFLKLTSDLVQRTVWML